jgi:hypothetical protein
MQYKDERKEICFQLFTKMLIRRAKNLSHRRFKLDMIATIAQSRTTPDLKLCRDAINAVLVWEAKCLKS